MIKPSALLGWLLPCCATPSSDATTLKALLDSRNVGILSAACCDASAAPKDDELKRNVLQAMEQAGDHRPLVVETITGAQQHLRTLQAEGDAQQKQLIGNVVALFQANGLSIFPLVIVGGRVAFYGGVPTVEALVDKLRRQPLTVLSA